jgi:hypothetical protein
MPQDSSQPRRLQPYEATRILTLQTNRRLAYGCLYIPELNQEFIELIDVVGAGNTEENGLATYVTLLD